MGHDASTLRLFVAVYPPAGVADALLRAAETLDLPDRRLLPPEQVHLTVQFVGERLKIDLARVE